MIGALPIVIAIFLSKWGADSSSVLRILSRSRAEASTAMYELRATVKIALGQFWCFAICLFLGCNQDVYPGYSHALVHRVAGELRFREAGEKGLPPSGTENAVDCLATEGLITDALRRNYPTLEHGTDGWGTPLIYEADAKQFVVRSCGPNKSDDMGVSDDIEIRVSLLDDNEHDISQSVPMPESP